MKIYRNIMGELKKSIFSAKEIKPFSFDLFLSFRIVLQEKVEQVLTSVLLSSPVLGFGNNNLGRGHRY